MSSWGKSGSAWAGRSAATASSTNPEESVFSTLQIDGRSQGKSNGAWGKKQTHKEEDTKKFGSTTTKYVSTLWGAIAREKEKQEASRTIPTLGKTGFGTSKTGFGKTGTTGFGTGTY